MEETEQGGLVDIRAIRVDAGLPKTLKLVEWIRQLNGKPHRFFCGEFIVNTRHDENGPSLEQCLHGMATY